MSNFNEKLAEIAQRDPRYSREAYEFLFHALQHTQQMLGRLPPEGAEPTPGDNRYHVSGPELLRGACALAVQEFGALARTVFRMWGVQKTDDFGNIVFNLIENDLMSKTDQDSHETFHNVFDIDQVLSEGFKIELDH